MNKNYLIIGLIILSPVFTRAQDFVDALRYSSSKIEGTARSGAMGNAFGALGGDFTAVAINPAGLGIYRAGEFALTPNFGRTDVDASYIGTTMNDYKYNFKFNNLSYVATLKSGSGSGNGLVNVNFGIGYNRLNDFNTKMLVQGARSNASFLDYIAENANYDDWSEFYEDLAWEAYLINFDEQANEYWHDIRDAGYGHSQRKSYRYSGSVDEYTFGVGLNFSHRFYFGASVGIADLYYKESTSLKEWDEQGRIPYFREFEYKFNSYLRTSGTGYNFKIGAIVRPIDILRLGVAVHTPTFYNLRDNFETSMDSYLSWSDGGLDKYAVKSPFLDYDYRLETPFKATFSAAVILAKRGLLSVDYEYLNYGKSRLRDGGNGEDFIYQNQDIAELYKAVGNIRVGGEYRLTDEFSVRAGFEHYPSAFKSNAFGSSQLNADSNYSIAAFGLGYKTGGFFVDAAYRAGMTSEYNTLYPSPLTSEYPAPVMAKFDKNINKLLFTLGFRF
jgi:hypothetical protein